MKKVILLYIACLLLAGNVQFTNACSCSRATVEESFKSAKSVFVWEVIWVRRTLPRKEFSEYMQFFRVSVDVSRAFKWDIPKHVYVFTQDSGASCGYNFEPSQQYLIYTYEIDGEERVSLCSRTQLLSDSQDEIEQLPDEWLIIYWDNKSAERSRNYMSYLLLLLLLSFSYYAFISIRTGGLSNHKK